MHRLLSPSMDGISSGTEQSRSPGYLPELLSTSSPIHICNFLLQISVFQTAHLKRRGRKFYSGKGDEFLCPAVPSSTCVGSPGGRALSLKACVLRTTDEVPIISST